MKWEHVAHLEWQAKGKYGDFLIWKDGRRWKARYWNKDKTKHFFLASHKTLKEMKAFCEDNGCWEVER